MNGAYCTSSHATSQRGVRQTLYQKIRYHTIEKALDLFTILLYYLRTMARFSAVVFLSLTLGSMVAPTAGKKTTCRSELRIRSKPCARTSVDSGTVYLTSSREKICGCSCCTQSPRGLHFSRWWRRQIDGEMTIVPWCCDPARRNESACFVTEDGGTGTRISLFFRLGAAAPVAVNASAETFICARQLNSFNVGEIVKSLKIRRIDPQLAIPVRGILNSSTVTGGSQVVCQYDYLSSDHGQFPIFVYWRHSREQVAYDVDHYRLIPHQVRIEHGSTLYLPDTYSYDDTANDVFACIANSSVYKKSLVLGQVNVTRTNSSVRLQATTSDFAVVESTAPRGGGGGESGGTTRFLATACAVVATGFVAIFSIVLYRWRRRKLRWVDEEKSRTIGLTKWELSRYQLKLGHSIGEGYSGVVMKATAKGESFSGAEVAVKIAKHGCDGTDLAAEAGILAKIGHHENIVRLLGVCSKNGPLWVVLEFAEQGNLLSYLRAQRRQGLVDCGASDFKKKTIFGLQIASGMKYLASKRCLHRDLAARNVLVSKNEALKISDFGLARDVRYFEYYRKKSQGALPFKWTAPEALVNKIYTEFSDVWSFGILLWEMATLGETPYPGISVEQLYDLLSRTSYRMAKPLGCPDDLYGVMVSCWKRKANSRPYFSQLVNQFKDMQEQEKTAREISEPDADSAIGSL